MDRDRIALGLGALAALQLLHLLDELRTDEAADLATCCCDRSRSSASAAPSSRLLLVRRGAPLGRLLALSRRAWSRSGSSLARGSRRPTRTKPYWGDGSADVLQWLGVRLIWACCAALAVLLLRPKEAA